MVKLMNVCEIRKKQVNDLKEVLGKLIKDRTDEFSVMIDSLEQTINKLDTKKSKK